MMLGSVPIDLLARRREMAEGASRPPPANVEVEQALLGAILINNNVAYVRVADFLAPEHFSNPVHGRIYAAIGKLIERGRVADPVMLKNLFDQDGALTEIGGAQYLVRLVESAVTILNAEHYGREIVDLAQRRGLIDLGRDLTESAYSGDLDAAAPAIIAATGERLLEIERIAAGSTALGLTVASSLTHPPPARRWLVEDWIPQRQVTLLSGDGGIGKSLLGMQLQVACASAGASWLGLPAMPCRSFGLYAEDEEDELHHRLWNIASLAGVQVAGLDAMAWRSAAADAAELVETDERGAIRATAYYRQVERMILGLGARLVVLDAVTNLFGGDEIKRRQVNQFVGLLRRLAIKIDGAVVLIAHPSVQGIASGTGLSGSTQWNNAVRSRLYFERAKGEDADPDERTLSRLKANYASAGQVIRARWRNGGFVAIEPPSGVERAAMTAKVERVFVGLLARTYAASIWTSPNSSARNYAPTVFAADPDREEIGKPAFEAAMHSLLRTERIRSEAYGRPSDPRYRLAPT
jgi:RecA-family ATPase